MKLTSYRAFLCRTPLMRSLASVVTIGLLSLMPAAVAAQSNSQSATGQITLVAFGDSLTAGYLLPPSAAFPAQLQVALAAKGYKVEIVNAGVSGDTTSGGLERIEWTLQSPADGVILELGANDALRGIDPKVPRENLDKMLTVLKSKGLEVLLAGMRAPQNWGPDYAKTFDAIFPELAAKHTVSLYPFFLDGVALDPALVMQDGLHPTEKGVAEIVRRILPQAEELIQKIEKRKAAFKK
jgi:acyl-CoA thioesterase I